MIFYYWLPKLTKEQLAKGGQLDRQLLAAAGLADVLADVRDVPGHCSLADEGKGPDGGPGVLLTPVSKGQGVPEWVVYKQERMQFKRRNPHPGPLPKGEGVECWIGALTGQPPTPHDLERAKVLGGAMAVDQGGWEWKVPVARAPRYDRPFGVLPQSYTFDAAGEPTPNLNAEWQWLWDLSGEIRQWYVQADGLPEDATPEAKAAHKEPEFKQLVKWAARLLAVNYRLGPAELTLLHEMGRPVLTEQVVHATCQAAYGWDLLEEAKKKPDTEEPPATS